MLASVAGSAQRVVFHTAGGQPVVLVCGVMLEEMQQRLQAAADGQNAAGEAQVHLTVREQQVIGCIAEGLSAGEVAMELQMASSTVSQHLVSVRRKYRVATTGDAVSAAFRSGHIG